MPGPVRPADGPPSVVSAAAPDRVERSSGHVPHGLGGVLKFHQNWSTSRAAYPLGYSPALDGVRGFMTLGVMAWHSRVTFVPGAVTFMDVFFVMSGYLITSLLINERERSGRIDIVKFYKRRFMRLYPALLAMLVVFLIFAWFFSSQFRMRLIDAGLSVVYLANYARAFSWPGLWYTAHTWSLSVEEQFYLLWPLTFVVLMRAFGVSWKAVAAILGLAIGFALCRVWLLEQGATIRRIYSPFEARADMLLIGCALAFVLKLVDLPARPRWSRAISWCLWPLAALALVGLFTVSESMRWYYYVAPLMVGLPAALFTAALLQPDRTALHRCFETPVLVFCGRLCYGLYVWHYPIFALMLEMNFGYVGVLCLGWPLVFALAVASYYLIERHFMRARPV